MKIRAAATAVAVLSVISPALAQAPRAFVSAAHGLDTNPCSATSPCRSITQALTVIASGGDITMLDPGGYGSFSVNKSVNITNDGVGEVAINAPPNQDAIIIGAGPTDIVTLRGLTIIGSGGASPGSHGITFTSGGTFNIQNCVVRGFANAGINLDPTGSTNFTLSDLVLANDGTNGIAVVPTGTGMTTHVHLERVVSNGNVGQMNNGTGFAVNGSFSTGTINVAIVDSTAHSNSTGFFVQSASGHATTNVTLVDAKTFNNNTGISVTGAGATGFLRHSTISGNPSDGYAVTAGGVLKSFGDNAVVDTTNLGSITPLLLQ
jgi:hypothetical protein